MVFFARPDCELDRFAAEGLSAHAALERLREKAIEPAYDDDRIPDAVSAKGGLLDEDEPYDLGVEENLPDDILPEDWPDDEDWLLDWNGENDLLDAEANLSLKS
jgi:hypothetical protein